MTTDYEEPEQPQDVRMQAPPAQAVASAPPPTLTKPPEERRALLAQNVMTLVAQGYRVESQSDYMAVMVYGKRVNHLLHFFIGIFTLGIWWAAWLIMAIFGGEKRKMVSVDDFGNVRVQKA